MNIRLTLLVLLLVIAAGSAAYLLNLQVPDIDESLLVTEKAMPAKGTTPSDEVTLFGSEYYQHGTTFDSAHLPAKDAPGPGIYELNTRARFLELLRSDDAELLVAPCTVIAKDAAAFDNTERTLINLRIVNAIRARTGRKVFDPTLVARALGEGRRRIRVAEIKQLAREINATTVITCATGHYEKHPRGEAKLRLKLFDVVMARFDNLTAGLERDYTNRVERLDIEFSEEHLPNLALIPILDSLITEVIGDDIVDAPAAQTATTAVVQREANGDAIPASLSDFYASESAEASVWRLALLASLYPQSSRVGVERVAIKLLLAAEQLHSDNPSKSLATARALYLLGRRPAALAAIADSEETAARVLKATLNGNLPELALQTTRLPAGIQRLIAEIDLADVRFEYNALPEKQRMAAIAEVVAPLGELGPVVKARMESSDLWGRLEDGAIKNLLDEMFPLPGASLEDLITGKLVLNQSTFDAFFFETAAMRHVNRVVDSNPEDWCCEHAGDVDKWDVLNLIDVLNEMDTFRQVAHQIYSQGRPDRALGLLDKLKKHFDGHPEFASLQAWALMKQAKSLSGPERAELLRLASPSIRNALYWSNGQSWASANALSLALGVREIPKAFSSNSIYDMLSHDFPMRHYWPGWSQGGMARAIARNLESKLRHTTFYFAPAERFIENMAGREGPQRALEILDSFGERFSGSDRLTQARLKYSLADGDQTKVLALLQQAVDENSEDWNVYDTYARHQIENGNFEEARKVVLAYPGFGAGDTHSSVTLSNYAYKAGSYFFWRGLTAPATELYSMAAEYGSGSEGHVASMQRLAILDSRFGEAATIALRRANRYNSPYAF